MVGRALHGLRGGHPRLLFTLYHLFSRQNQMIDIGEFKSVLEKYLIKAPIDA
jgi:hypothetical protein